MRANPLSQLWQMAVDSALNLEISHCFCFPPVFAQISQQKAAPCRCLLLLNLIFFQREWQFAPWCAFTMFWLLLTAVVAQRASWPECLAGETVLSQQWMSRRLPHHEDPPSGDHDEDGAKILSKRLFLKTKTMKDLPYTGSIISGCLKCLNRVPILNDGSSCFQEPEEDQGDSTIPSLSFLSTARIDSQKWIYLILFQSVKLK